MIYKNNAKKANISLTDFICLKKEKEKRKIIVTTTYVVIAIKLLNNTLFSINKSS